MVDHGARAGPSIATWDRRSFGGRWTCPVDTTCARRVETLARGLEDRPDAGRGPAGRRRSTLSNTTIGVAARVHGQVEVRRRCRLRPQSGRHPGSRTVRADEKPAHRDRGRPPTAAAGSRRSAPHHHRAAVVGDRDLGNLARSAACETSCGGAPLDTARHAVGRKRRPQRQQRAEGHNDQVAAPHGASQSPRGPGPRALPYGGEPLTPTGRDRAATPRPMRSPGWPAPHAWRSGRSGTSNSLKSCFMWLRTASTETVSSSAISRLDCGAARPAGPAAAQRHQHAPLRRR